MTMGDPDEKGSWFFFSNYAHVLVCLSKTPQPTTREIALRVGITERAAQRIVTRLVEAGIARIRKQGRRNIYDLDLDRRLRHPLESHRTLRDFLRLINPDSELIV